MGYLPIEDYGIVGDLHTVALVGKNGSVDWFCFPKFDSPSIFGAILDENKGGRFQIYPDGDFESKQIYLPDTNVLITRFFLPDGLAELTDFMPIADEEHQTWNHRLIRKLEVIKGTVKFKLLCSPAFNYARDDHNTVADQDGVIFHSDNLSIGLTSDQPLEVRDKAAVAEFTLDAGKCASFYLHRVESNNAHNEHPNQGEIEHIFQDTIQYWHNWLHKCTYQGRWREMVYRSALALKLLTYAPTGAIVAAPTTSLPEAIGAPRNWDYRYTWIRDASFTIYSLLRLGFDTEASAFMGWIEERCKEIDKNSGEGLQIMYTIDGGHIIQEEELSHLSGYRNSKPVRVGNAAYKQLQLDIYGELMDSVYLYNKDARIISYDQWRSLRALMGWLEHHWNDTDDGLWEVRSGKQRFVYSRMMIWVAFDRARRIAEHRGLPSDLDKWRKCAADVYEQVMAKGWSDKLNSFVQYYGSDILDASNLMMPLVKFLGPTDPRMMRTLDATLDKLTYGSLVYRYDPSQGAKDGLTGAEGTFTMCSFWLVEALTRAGRLAEARLHLEKIFSYANHLSLFSEEIGTSGEMLGNYPQAFTHLSLISAAYNLDKALNSGRLIG